MKSIAGNIEIDYMEGRNDIGVVYKDGKFSHYLIGGEVKNLYDMVTMTKEYIYENDLTVAKKLLSLWKPLIYQSEDENLISYYHSVDFEHSYWRFSSMRNERNYQEKFNEKVEYIFPEYKLIKRKNNPKHIPDAWVEQDGEEIPVEMKLNDFNEKALKQLRRYMNVYKTNKGIAIGKNLTVDLPSDIRFISLDELE